MTKLQTRIGQSNILVLKQRPLFTKKNFEGQVSLFEIQLKWTHLISQVKGREWVLNLGWLIWLVRWNL